MAFREVKWGEDIGDAGDIDGEILPIRCICGHGDYWQFTISIYEDHPNTCPKCRRKYYFRNSITVFCEEADEGNPGKTSEERFEETKRSLKEAAERIDALRGKNAE